MLKKLQNRAMRIILSANRYISIQLMLDTLEWLSVKQTKIFNSCVLIQKMIIGLTPNSSLNYITLIKDKHSFHTRQKINFK